MSQPTVPAVHSSVRILDALSSSPKFLSFSELQQQLDIPKSSLSRLLTTLTSTQLIQYQDGRYGIGIKVLNYAAAYTRQLDIVEVFQHFAQQIVDEIDETTQLAQLQGHEVVFLAKRDCRRLIRPAAYPGRRVAAYATAVGKAQLAQLNQPQLFELYPNEELPQITPFTIKNRHSLERELEIIRERGYATTKQESTLNLCCFSSPIWDMTGNVVAALSICLATDNPDPQRHANAARMVVLQADNITRALGGSTLISLPASPTPIQGVST